MYDDYAYPELIYSVAADRVRELQQARVRRARRQRRRSHVLGALRLAWRPPNRGGA